MSDKNSEQELSLDEMKAASGGYKAGGGAGGRKTAFSQSQTSFTELGSIERNFKNKTKKADKLLDGQPEHGHW